jgi:voltage-gated potassium channel
MGPSRWARLRSSSARLSRLRANSRRTGRLSWSGSKLPALPENPTLQEKVDHWLTVPDTPQGRLFEFVIAILILAVCVFYALERSAFVPVPVQEALYVAELGITVLFLLEYLVRWWARGFSLRYLVTPMALIDLAAILPLIPLASVQGMRVLRLLRILRIFRVLQTRKFFFGELAQEQLLVLRILFTVFALFFITGGLVYEVEHAAGNKMFPTFFEGIYFAVVTLTTVGFGDITPMTKAGKALTMVAVLAGITIIPWQLANLARFMLADRRKVNVTCKHCGLQRHDKDASHCKACGNLIFQLYDGGAEA